MKITHVGDSDEPMTEYEAYSYKAYCYNQSYWMRVEILL